MHTLRPLPGIPARALGGFMRRRTWLVLILCVVVVGGAVTLSVLPEVIRRIAIARIESSTGRAATIERIRIDVLTGRFVIRGFRLSERERTIPFADFRRLDGRIHLPSL